MVYENPENIIRSWNQQTKFQLGPVVMDKLVPPTFGRIRTNHVNVWREERVSTQLDFSSENFSLYLPESLRALNSVYLQIDLPVLSGGTYKDIPGLYIIKQIRLVSNGQEVYTCRYSDFLVDYCQSLDEPAQKQFCKTYLGQDKNEVATATARRVMLPILLPNSAYLGRHGKSSRGQGIFPCVTGSNRVELQITLNDADFCATDTSHVPDSIAGACSFLYHECQMRQADLKNYSDMRGVYKIFTRRFTDLTSGWQHYASANSVAQWTISQPQGLCTEIMLIAVANQATEDRYTARDYVKATSFKISADNVVQRDLDTKEKIAAELWTNGFIETDDFPHCARLCFGSHMSDATHMYTGGYVMKLASNIIFEFSFPVQVRFRIVAVQLQTVAINSDGVMTATLQ